MISYPKQEKAAVDDEAHNRGLRTISGKNTPSADQPEAARMRARANNRGPRDRDLASAGGTRRQYVDEMMDDYVSWRDACAAVAVSYENWKCSDRPDKKLAFSVYVAALDREEQAATAYQRAVAQVATA
jgi:hypothetical protein